MSGTPRARAASGETGPDERAQMLQRAVDYLDSFRTLRAAFTQIAPDGGLATGTLYLARPGRMRIDYDPPSQVLLVATDWRLVYYDSSIKQRNVIPLRSTPLSFILAPTIDLQGDLEVASVERVNDEIQIVITRADAPDQGHVRLFFADDPVELRRWAVVDPQGLETLIILEAIDYDVALDSELFRARDPDRFGWPQ